MKKHHFISVTAQRLDRSDDFLRRFIKIGNKNHDSPPPEKLLKIVQRLGEIGSSAGFGLLPTAQQADKLSLPCGRANVRTNFIIKNDQARRVALVLDRKIK